MAFVLSLMMMAVVFETVTVARPPSVNAKLTKPRSMAPSVKANVATSLKNHSSPLPGDRSLGVQRVYGARQRIEERHTAIPAEPVVRRLNAQTTPSRFMFSIIS